MPFFYIQTGNNSLVCISDLLCDQQSLPQVNSSGINGLPYDAALDPRGGPLLQTAYIFQRCHTAAGNDFNTAGFCQSGSGFYIHPTQLTVAADISKIICSTPIAAIFRANSTASIPPLTPQPSIAAFPSLASIPTTT